MKIAMVILAAGLSRRMGVFKPLLPVGGMPAVLRCVRLAESAGVRDIYIVTGNRRDELEAAVRKAAPDVQFIHNEHYRDGMFSSITAGARGLPPGYDGFFLLPADTCAVSPDTLKILMDVFADNGGASVVRPRKPGDRRGHPPLIPSAFIGTLLSYSGEDGMRGFLRSCPYIEAQTDDPGVLLDMDAPEDYAELLQYLGLPVYPDAEICAELLDKHSTPPQIVEHGKQVAALALKLAHLIERKGAGLDLRLLESSCLLHDICRTETHHDDAGMKFLLLEGYPRAAILTGGHMERPDAPLMEIGEAELLFLADKLCRRGGFATVEETLDDLQAKFKDDHEALFHARGRMGYARKIMDMLGERYGVGYEDII